MSRVEDSRGMLEVDVTRVSWEAGTRERLREDGGAVAESLGVGDVGIRWRFQRVW